MGPLGIALAAGATVLALDKLYDWYKTPRALKPGELPLVDPLNKPGEVSLLDRGRTYLVRVMFDVREMARQMGVELTVPDKEGGGRYIKDQFEKAGFKVLSEPVPRSEEESLKFHKAFASEWVFNAQWQRVERVVSLPPAVAKIFPSATFVILPVA